MKFFTKEIYEKMQVSGYLLYPDMQEDIDEILDLYESDEMADRENFLIMKPLMLKYLPESLKSSVYDESLNPSIIPDDYLLSQIIEWQKSIDNEWNVINSNYNKHCNSIKNLLPQNMFELCSEYSFHDAEILSVQKSNDQVELELDCSECRDNQGTCLLTFTGVKLLETPDDLSEDYWWLYDEVHLSDEGNFDFQVLLVIDGDFLTLNEIRIIADDVNIEVIER